MPGSAKDTCASEERRRHKDRWAGNRDRQCLFGAPFPFSTHPSPSRSVSGVVMSEGVGTLSNLPLLPNHDGETSLTVRANLVPLLRDRRGLPTLKRGNVLKRLFWGGRGLFVFSQMKCVSSASVGNMEEQDRKSPKCLVHARTSLWHR